MTHRQKIPQASKAAKVSPAFGKAMIKKPWPLTVPAKLDAQKGMKKKRKTCQRPRLIGLDGNPVELKSMPNPICNPIPSEVNHNAGEELKYSIIAMLYQIK
jgi:hypothetical protein